MTAKGKKPLPIEERFFPKIAFIPFHTCWEWMGTKNRGGYGSFLHSYQVKKGAHQISWEIHYGPIPSGLCVLHKCDNPGCVNPEHLFLGTKRDNTLDMVKKRRHNPKKEFVCRDGHTKHHNGKRLVCKECARINNIRYRKKKETDAIDRIVGH